MISICGIKRSLYRMFDPGMASNNTGAPIEVESFDEAESWNSPIKDTCDWQKPEIPAVSKKWGIYWTVNEFEGARKIKNLKRINAWAIDIDAGAKSEQFEKFKQHLKPSSLIESKRGYQAYWHSKNATVENYKIIQDRLVYYFAGDDNAKDLARLLRAPWYLHWKNPDDPFLVQEIYSNTNVYTESQMLKFFPEPCDAQDIEIKKNEIKRVFKASGTNLWERIWNLDCEMALERISGKAFVGGESFSFRRNANGNLNILVNGKGTSCWIDKDKRIGSAKKGGPSIFNWIKFYNHTNSATAKIMKEEFPELWTK